METLTAESVHSVTPHLFIWGLRYLKNHGRGGGGRGGGQDFLVKMGVSHTGRLSIEGRGHCYLIMIHGFCGNNALDSASLSFAKFIHLLTPFDT